MRATQDRELEEASQTAERAGCSSLQWKIAFARRDDSYAVLSLGRANDLLDRMDSIAVRVMRRWLVAAATRVGLTSLRDNLASGGE